MTPLSPSAVEYVKSAKAGLGSLEYIDDLVREYLLFRGFNRTLEALEHDLTRDQDKGFKAEKIVSDLLAMAKELRVDEMLEYWRYLSFRFFSHLSPKYHRTTRMFEKRLIRLFLVSAVNMGKRNQIREFMDKHGHTLGQQGGDWIPWLGIEYVEDPKNKSEFEAYFSDEWFSSLNTALTDFISTVFPAMAVPRILLFDRYHRERETLKKKVKLYEEQLKGETTIKALEIDVGPPELVEDHIGDVAAVTSPRLQPSTSKQHMQSNTTADYQQSSLELVKTKDPSSLLKISQEDIFLEHNSGISLAKFSATAELIASYDDESILKVWSPNPASSAQKLKNELDFMVSAMAWDKKHTHLLYLYDEDGYIHTLNVNTNLMSRQLVADKKHPWIHSMLTSTASSALMNINSTSPESTSDIFVQIWDASANKTTASKRLVTASESQGVCAALNHNGNLAVLGYNTGYVRLIDTRSLETVTTVKTKQKDLCAVEFSLEEDSFMAVTEVGGLTQWSLHKDSQMLAESSLGISTANSNVLPSESRLYSDRIAFTPDKENLIVAPKDQCLVFNVDSAALTDTTRRHKDLVSCIDYAANKSLSASEDGTIRVACYRKV
ncbi:hypothetical protein GGI25_002399 [Coemansia spiralis]|uniref:ARMC9 CTLH-like domain-containing protein n=2 Tax=Coemansia TaxID=4863 RepID=A0A9W8KXI9_9FUNG|nr:hypothetical protein EDC05_003516 [Coemansia umbellata]KAJ2622205.1 hypothetical protein GGI26_003500 [Coemansia sp. RSA 1358]KAJ2678414.1 hypothetical protein GGI25_002399 [Coemansia spiralis]